MEGLDVGQDVGSGVDFTYKLPFVFTGKERFFQTYPVPLPGRERLMKQGLTFTHVRTARTSARPRGL